LLERALIATRASRRIELKETFDPDEKDIAALANSGGGVVLFGVDKHGAPTGAELPSVAEARARSAGVLAGWTAGVSPAAAGRRRASRRDGGVPFLEKRNAAVPAAGPQASRLRRRDAAGPAAGTAAFLFSSLARR